MALIAKSLLLITILQAIGLMIFRWALLPRFRGEIRPKIIILVLLLPAAILLSANPYILYGYLVLAMLFASTRRREVGIAFLLMLPMVPELETALMAGSTYLLQFSNPIALGVGGLLGLVITRGRGAPARRSLDLAVCAIVLLFAFIEGRDGSATVTLRAVIFYILQLGVPYLIISRSVTTPEDMRSLLLGFCLAGVMASTICLYEAMNRWSLYEVMFIHMGLPRSATAALNIRAGLMRAPGPILNVTAFGLFISVALAALLGAKPCFRGVGYRVVVAIVLVALAASQSRGAWIGAGSAYIAICLFRGQMARAALTTGAVGVLFAAGETLFAGNERLSEAVGASGASLETANYRVRLLERGMEEFWRHPLIGQPSNALRNALQDLVQGQGIVDFVNAHLFVLMGAGLAGFLIWLAAWATGLGVLIRTTVRAPNAVRIMASAPLGMIVASLVGLIFTAHVYRTVVWPIVALGMIGACAKAARLAARAAADSRRGAMPTASERIEEKVAA